MPKKLLLVHLAYTFGGAERTTLNMLDALQSNADVHVTLLAPAVMRRHWENKVDRYLDADGLALSGWFTTPGKLQQDARQMVSILRQVQPDGIIGMMQYISVVLAKALTYFGQSVPVIASFRGPVFEHLAAYEPSWIRRWWIKWLLQRSAQHWFAITVPGAGTGQELLQHGVCRQDKIHVIPNGIAAQSFRTLGKASLELPYGLQTGQYVLGLGRLSAEKRFAHLLESYALSGIDWPLVIVGEGPEHAGLARLAAQHGLSHRVHLFPATAFPERWLARAAVFIHTCRYEGFGYTLLEAAALGVPTIATDCRYGPREVLGDAGVLVPPDDVAALAASIRRLYDQPELRARLSVALQHRAEHFPLWQSQQLHSALIEYIVGPHSADRRKAHGKNYCRWW